MQDTNLSLDDFNYIYIPPEVGFFPLSDGYIAMLIFILSLLISLSYFVLSSYISNSYKREAIRELKEIKDEDISSVFNLIKRVLLTNEDRVKVASLSGDSFISYIGLTQNSIVKKANLCIYDKTTSLSKDEYKEFHKTISLWLKNYKAKR